MAEKNVRGTDQFFHCLATCRAQKNTGDEESILFLTNIKEERDYLLNLTGLYGDGRLSNERMLEDMQADRDANSLGIQCATSTSCEEHCGSFLDDLPERRRPFMREYRDEW